MRINAVLLCSLSLLVLGCGGNVSYTASSKTVPTPVSTLSSVITIAGVAPLTAVGQTLQLHASESAGTGSVTDVTLTATWQVSPAGPITVNGSGLVTCVAAGTSQVSASKDGAVNSVAIACTAPVVPTTISLTGIASLTAVGQTLQLHASESAGTGSVTDVTLTATWQVSPAGPITVNGSGLVTCVAAGTSQVSASKDGAVNSVAIACTAPVVPTTISLTGIASLTAVGQTLQLHASESNGAGVSNDITNSAIWQIAPAGPLTVSASGLITCLSAGTATVTVAKDGASANTSLTCSVPAIAVSSYPNMSITGATSLTGLGATSQLSASQNLSSTASNDVTGSVTWKSSSSDKISVNASAIVTCLNVGQSTISASTSKISADTSVSCSLGSSTLALSKESMSVRVGAPAPIIALGTSPGNIAVNVSQSAAWSSGSAIATVSSTGLVSCLQDGTTTITTTLDTLTKSIPLTCSPSTWNTPSYYTEQSDEFVGPLAGWVNVKTQFGAVGDGHTDDTAAIQAALDSLENANKCVVLYFPAGTYATGELKISHAAYFTVVGADPHTTGFHYIGRKGGTMLQLAGASYFLLTRLFLDGAGLASLAEEITQPPEGSYNSFIQITDQHIFGVDEGLALTMSAETTIDRVFFDNLPVFGVQTGNFNVLNIFINDCLFFHNGTGVTNTPNAGSFIVANSFFWHSTVADMSIGNTAYFTARHNTSVGSAAFFAAGGIGANPAQIMLQNNTILDPTSTPFQLGNQGPLMLFDNVVRTLDPKLPAISAVDDNTVSRSIFSFGNTYTTSLPPVSGQNLPLQGVFNSYDDNVADPTSIPDVAVPPDVYTPPNLHRQIFEVPTDDPISTIQAQINLAASSGGPGAVVHIPWGNHHGTVPLTIPVGSNLQLIGDDSFATALIWDGTGKGPAVEVDSSTVTMKGFRVVRGTGSLVDAFRMPIVDQPTTQLIVDQTQLQYGVGVSVSFEGIEHATAELHSTYVLGSITGLDVTGGPFRSAGVGGLGVTNYYSGSAQSTATSTSFNISHGGRLLVQDNWHDGGASGPRNFVLSGSGTLTEQVGKVGMLSDMPFEIDNFDGKITLIGLIFEGGFLTNPGKSTTNLLALGLDGNSADYEPQSKGNLIVANILNEYYDKTGGHQLPSGSLPEVKWLRNMLAQTRSQYAAPRLPLVLGTSRLRLNRLWAQDMAVGFHILPKTVSTKLYYNLVSGGNALTTGPKGTGACSVSVTNASLNPTAWTMVETGDGDYLIVDATGMNALGTSSGSSDVVLAPRDSQYDQRWIIQDVGDGRKLVQNRLLPGVLAWKLGSCPQVVADRNVDAAKWTFVAN